jgi:hypothetical protein
VDIVIFSSDDSTMLPRVETVAIAVALSMSTISRPVPAQSPDLRESAELAAAREILASGNVPQRRPVAIEPDFSDDSSAPGYVSERFGRRPAARSEALARALGGRVATVRELRNCPNCAEVVLTLSDPVIKGDTAIVAVTATYGYRGRRRRFFSGYETVRFTMVRVRGAWRVIKSEQLGVT